MASPSTIPAHPLVQMLDYEGLAFPTGSSYYLKNLCSNFHQTLSINPATSTAETRTARPDPASKWLLQHENNDRSKIALKSAADGRYLALTSADCKAPLALSEQMTWWYVYAGSAPGTYWLGSAQARDCFLHTWDCSGEEGAEVASFTNRDPSRNWSNIYNAPYGMFEEWGAGLSWGLDPTPELKQWKDQQGASSQDQQGSDEVRERERAVAEKEAQVQQREAELQLRNEEFGKREREIEGREKATVSGEEALRAGLETRSKDFEKSYDELKKREEAVRAAEERVKKSKKGGKADLLATEEEKDRALGESKGLRAELDAAKEQIVLLKGQVQQAQQQQSSRTRGSSGQSLMNGYKAHTIRSPEIKRPEQKLPERALPGQKLPELKKPGGSLPGGFDAAMMKKFESGKKAMGVRT